MANKTIAAIIAFMSGIICLVVMIIAYATPHWTSFGVHGGLWSACRVYGCFSHHNSTNAVTGLVGSFLLFYILAVLFTARLLCVLGNKHASHKHHKAILAIVFYSISLIEQIAVLAEIGTRINRSTTSTFGYSFYLAVIIPPILTVVTVVLVSMLAFVTRQTKHWSVAPMHFATGGVILSRESGFVHAQSGVSQGEIVVAHAHGGVPQGGIAVAHAQSGVIQGGIGFDHAQGGVPQRAIGVVHPQIGVQQSGSGVDHRKGVVNTQEFPHKTEDGIFYTQAVVV